MHNAPSVSYPAGRSRFAALLLLSMWLLGCLALLLWQGERPGGARTGAMLALLVASGFFAGFQWWRAPAGTLAWDGTRWEWSGQPQATAAVVDVALDLQRAMLLQWTSAHGSRWVWLDRARHPERWDDVRRAVYSRARPTALHKAERAAAKS